MAELSIRHAQAGDERMILDASHLFDAPATEEWARTFLRQPNHHLLLAFREEHAVGFVSAVELVHPDKGTEMFLYELAVDPDHRRRGIAGVLLNALTALARERGCYDMWVLTDSDNEAAVRAYRRSGAHPEGEHLMLTWEWATEREPST